jgi:hypothetical protein
MAPDTDPPPAPDIPFHDLRAPLDALAAHDFDGVYVGGDMDGFGERDAEGAEPADTEEPAEVAEPAEAKQPTEDTAADASEPEEPQEPFVPLGSEDPVEEPVAPPGMFWGAHTAIARSLQAPVSIPRVLRKEARSFFDGAMYAYTEGDLPGARLTFLAVAGIGDPDTAPAAMVFLGVIAYRHRDVPEARMWFSRAAAGADEHWARVAAEELRRLG